MVKSSNNSPQTSKVAGSILSRGCSISLKLGPRVKRVYGLTLSLKSWVSLSTQTFSCRETPQGGLASI